MWTDFLGLVLLVAGVTAFSCFLLNDGGFSDDC